MRHRIPYLAWRNNLDVVVPKDRHIGDDFLLIDIAGRKKYSREPFISDVTVGIIITEGWAVISVNMVEYRIEAPGIIIILKDRIARSVEYSEDMDGFALTMSDRFLMPMFSDISFSSELRGGIFQNPVMRIDDVHPIYSYKETLERFLASERCEFKMEAVRHLTLALFYGCMLATHKESLPESRTRNENILGSFLKLVESEYREHRSVIWYADRMYISPKYLSMAVKEASGKTPLDWIEEYCISAAKSMLSSTKMSVDEISIELNFASQSLFAKFFKRVAGCSPRDYRKSVDF